MSDRRRTGDHAEVLVAEHLERAGYCIEARNWSCKGGELDIVAARGRLLVFIEVRSARTGWLRSPTLTVAAKKQQRVARAADLYLRRRGGPAPDVRFDVVGVRFEAGAAHFEHIENAFVPPWGF